ncbi:MAG: hypothetical protein GY814_02940 [Gammaproteobacteria bacterium]|nr:hypothetical protein [Gammaproteobacteria bacterium]
MARKSLIDVAPRTIRVHIPTYNKILEFFRLSPSGICGSDAIRQVLMHYGNYCEDQMKAGRLASSQDLLEAENAVLNMFESTEGRPDKTEPTE